MSWNVLAASHQGFEYQTYIGAQYALHVCHGNDWHTFSMSIGADFPELANVQWNTGGFTYDAEAMGIGPDWATELADHLEQYYGLTWNDGDLWVWVDDGIGCEQCDSPHYDYEGMCDTCGAANWQSDT